MDRIRFSRYAWGVLIYNLAVILWGAIVRATGSGDGCSNHWPLCNGNGASHPHYITTIIEFTHRVMSGFALATAALLLIWALRVYPAGHTVRTGAKLAFLFMISEALIGAGLVLFKLVAHDASLYRAVAISAHLTNTFLLLLSLTLTAWWSSGGRPIRLHGQGAAGAWLALGLAGTLVLGVSGAITALGDTLFPSTSVMAGLHADFSPTAHLFIRLRILHPMIATSIGIYLVALTAMLGRLRPSAQARRYGRGIGLAVLIQMAAGSLNVWLLAPIWMQILHLLLADVLWILLVLFAASALTIGAPAEEAAAAYAVASPQTV